MDQSMTMNEIQQSSTPLKKLADGSLIKAIFALAAPNMLAMLVNVAYGMADTLFIGQLNEPNMIAAIALCMPIFTVLMAIGTVFSTGAGSSISRLIGMKQTNLAKNVSSFSVYTLLVVASVVSALMLVLINPLLQLCGASEGTIGYARQYLTIILTGGPLIAISFALGNIVRSEGDSRGAMWGMMIGAVSNIILDPVFIFVFHLNVNGVAYATVIANAIAIGFYVIRIEKRSEVLSLRLKHFKASGRLLKSILGVGLPAALSSLLMSAAQMLMNNFAISYGDIAMASFAVMHRINTLSVFLLLGLCVGVQPLVGYYFGAKDVRSMMATIRMTTLIGTGIAVTLAILVTLFSESLVRFFIGNEEVIRYGSRFLRINQISMPILSLTFILFSSLQSMGKGIQSMLLSISRQGFIFMPVLVLCNSTMQLNGLAYAQPVSDILSLFFSIFVFLSIYKKLKQNVGFSSAGKLI